MSIQVSDETRRSVRDAFAVIERADFLPDAVRHLADADRPVMIGWDATNSQPSTVFRMLELLAVRPGDRVLDVGSGSAWTTALLAHLAGEEGRVIGVERVPELVEFGRDRLAAAGVIARIERASAGVLGLPASAPFDRILVSADFARMPDALVDQLGEGGRMVAPIAGVMTVVDRRDGRVRRRQDAGLYTFVPLRED
ncbi:MULTISPECIES: methyltransferase domain-containing protein [unclassified Microbacterium]|uniref:protein-L-isoaspartate O-methyltransferase family protein n=1 Tax=unclassified Microbacterium TaxID=2609290 RepID=UPI001DA07DAA|nr:methyltransferase domain-containing protein [Microbacterium sp. Bi121]CAH0141363.1 Protein-L-isoaspartate O-methyltransferase [Microbacterium sp. Bi121]